ncbi:protein SPA1-RELATED 2-like isoform X1 [Chenopodium quinoa]|uniref:protein SPA1-RELATED 2-like isoform X1 n=1 Tax=Chenopodium quinoa TaxID=63459 RepID=UPI000B784A08|nr:protein SPA1-RELATED 2-like isoform X1 [Chenopodium quinoa]XP_021757616.1 protein SPA1-RELATED 2-like isoform X1 [Chenopodium quinoa]
MDEGDTEDVAPVSRAEDIRAQGKESENLVESCNVLEPRGRVTFREGDIRRSSVQQFVDMLGGNDGNSDVNVAEIPRDPCTSYHESGEVRVQELFLGDHSSGFGTMNEGEMMDTILNEWQHGYQPGIRSEAETSHEHLLHKEKSFSTSGAWKDSRPANVLAGQEINHNANVSPDETTQNESDAVLQHAFSSGAMRMKILSRSSECPEYFVRNTLKGKGVVCRGPISAAVELRGQKIAKAAAAAPIAASNLPVNVGLTSNPPVNVGPKSPFSSNYGVTTSAGCESVNDGMNLREWMRSRQNKPHKVDSLYAFKQILELVYCLHSDGKVLADLRPSSFRLLPSRKIEYFGCICAQKEMQGSIIGKDILKSQTLKRPLELGMSAQSYSGVKHQKSIDNANFFKLKSQVQLGCGPKPITNKIDANLAGPGVSKTSSRLHLLPSAQPALSVNEQQEEIWYRSPEELCGRGCTASSNIYNLGVFLFELLSSFDSGKVQATAMSDLRHRILPPNFLSANPKEAGFCLWLLHPEPSLRPTARDVLQSEVVSEVQALCGDEKLSSIQQDEGESELLLHFLLSVKDQKQKHASKLVEDLGCIDSDIKELEKRHLLKKSMTATCSGEEGLLHARERGFLYHGDRHPTPVFDGGDSRFMKNVSQLESAYFSARSQIHESVNDTVVRADREILKSREKWYSDQHDEEIQEPLDDQGAFFDGLCKYARYSKLKLCGTLRNRDIITNSTNVVCSLSFDRDEDYFAAAGVSKKIKIFDYQAVYDNSVDIHYPVIEMSNKSKLSCVCWNNYIKNYLASTDYDGIVKLWDASTGQEFSQYTEHEKRAWSVDFSMLDPMKLATGSDDCSVKLWSINEKNSLHTIRNIANVCCVQFSAHSSHLLAFGSADYKIYCYDLRNANAPWCVLAGHEKAVSYVKFVDSATLVSASTDNTLKLWDLSKSNAAGLSNNACSLTLGGHKNEKNFVGLSVGEGYIACGSETNEVYTYYKSLPMPITSHKFGSVDPISGKETDDGNGQFVSSVCWKGKSNVLVAANSSGCIKVLEMV